MTFFHFSRSWTQAGQFLIFIWQMSRLILSSHLYLVLPCDLLVRGFQLNIFLTVLVSDILCTWPNKLNIPSTLSLNLCGVLNFHAIVTFVVIKAWTKWMVNWWAGFGSWWVQKFLFSPATRPPLRTSQFSIQWTKAETDNSLRGYDCVDCTSF